MLRVLLMNKTDTRVLVSNMVTDQTIVKLSGVESHKVLQELEENPRPRSISTAVTDAKNINRGNLQFSMI